MDLTNEAAAKPLLPAEAPDLLAAVLRGAPFGVSVRSAEGEVVYANTVACDHAASAQAGAAPSDRAARIVEFGRAAVAWRDRSYDATFSFDVTQQRRLEEDLFRRAYFDELTSLPNRSLMEQAVNGLIAEAAARTPFALAFIDIDNFKHINDYYGHGVGDALLVNIVRRIGYCLRPSDMLARVGGDEFVLLINPLSPLEALAGDIEALLQRLKEPFFIDGHEIFSSASVGVSLYPRDGADYDVLRAHADNAMYRAKSGTKGGIHFFDPNIGHAAAERAKTEQRLRLAIRDQRLCCAYQPKVDFRSGTVTGVEALLRWRDEEGVIHPPGDFVNLAVELGLMDEITMLVLDETMASLDRIDQAFGPEARISLNVAAKQADKVPFMRELVRALDATGMPQRFMVELTEEAFFAKSQFQSHILPMLREIGAGVSIDDFGAGYSSLSALADITADEIKVDRSFIASIHQRPRSQSILRAIESLGAALDMAVLVEGVETADRKSVV